MASLSKKIPVFKKKLHSFLTKEDGKISKENLIKGGILATILSVGAAASAKQVSAGGKVTCDPSCDRIPDPEMVKNDDTDYDPVHYNSLVLRPNPAGGGAQGWLEGRHNHCIETCHNSHSSHNSHGSHGSHSQW